MNFYFLVYNDATGAFVDATDIQYVAAAGDGSIIFMKSGAPTSCFESPLKPREILRRISIIRYKRDEHGKDAGKS